MAPSSSRDDQESMQMKKFLIQSSRDSDSQQVRRDRRRHPHMGDFLAWIHFASEEPFHHVSHIACLTSCPQNSCTTSSSFPAVFALNRQHPYENRLILIPENVIITGSRDPREGVTRRLRPWRLYWKTAFIFGQRHEENKYVKPFAAIWLPLCLFECLCPSASHTDSKAGAVGLFW